MSGHMVRLVCRRHGVVGAYLDDGVPPSKKRPPEKCPVESHPPGSFGGGHLFILCGRDLSEAHERGDG